MDKLLTLWEGSGIYNLSAGELAMMLVGFGLLYLAIRKQFEPLLLVPIGFGGILANIPQAGLAFSAVEQAFHVANPVVMQAIAEALGSPSIHPEQLYGLYGEAGSATRVAIGHIVADGGYTNGVLYQFYSVAIGSGVAPLVIFMGVGAMTDFGPLLANPKTLFLGAAAQFGIFATVFGAIVLSATGVMGFSLADAAAIGIIGGADGPTAIYVSSVLAPHLLGAIAVAAYSYMALVPLIQPPIMRALTTVEERKIVMTQLRPVSKTEKDCFPGVVVGVGGVVVAGCGTAVGNVLLW